MIKTAAFVLCLSGLSIAAAQAQPNARENDTIFAQGTCTVQLAPDRARLTVHAKRQDTSAARAAASASSALNVVMRQIAALHLKEARLQMDGLQIEREDGETPDHKPQVRFVALAGLEVDTADIDGLANAVDAAARAGIDEIAPLQVYVSPARRDHAVQDCLPKASADAQAEARAVLAGIGLTTGRPTQIGAVMSRGAEQPPDDLFGMRARMFQVAAPAPAPYASVSSGPRTLTVSITVTFRIAPDQSGSDAMKR